MQNQSALAQYQRLLMTYLGPQRGRLIILALLLSASIGLQILNPLILRHFIDSAMAGSSYQTLMGTALLFIGIALVTQMITVAETYYSEQIAWCATDALRAHLTLHVIELDMDFHAEHTPGELIERVDGDISLLANFFSRFVIYVAGNLLFLVGIVGVLLSIDLTIGVALAGFAVAALFVMQQMREFAVPRIQALRQVKAELFGFLEERLHGTEEIRANGATDAVLSQLDPLLRDNLLRARAVSIASGAGWVMTVLLFVVGTVIALALGSYMLSQGAITVGTVYLIFNYTEQMRRPIELITRHLQDLQQASAGLARIQGLLSIRSTIDDGQFRGPLSKPMSVELVDVTFAYNASEPVLKKISFSLSPGRVLGLLGRTGSGKTTLARLLMRFHDPTCGRVNLAGVDSRSLSLDYLRQEVVMVTQDVQLLDATLRDNLTFFDPSISDQRLLEVIKELGLNVWYESLPSGLETRLSPSRLSAGQAQLVAMGRLFLKDPSLVILDEATARLDPTTARLLSNALARLLVGRTAIIIAHRLETIMKVDELLLLDGGQIVESGLRAQLMDDPHSRVHAMLHMNRGGS